MNGGKVIKVSVIVPVYNSVRHLPKSLESILEQTLTDIEVICVDDCSTDGSREYLESIQDPRLRVVNLPGNRGAGIARNTGMDVASGEYIYFMDSDDWIDRDYLEVLSKVADSENRNIVLNTNFKREYKEGESGMVVRHDPKEGLLAPGRYPASTAQAYAFPSLWIRLYRRKFLIDNDIRFPETLRRSEDVYFTSLAGLLESEAFVIQGPCYHYLQRESSLSASRDVNGLNFLAYNLLYKELVRRGISLEGVKLFYTGQVAVSSVELFEFIRGFLSSVEPWVRSNIQAYNEYDLYFMDAILSCGDFDSFRERFGTVPAISFVRRKGLIR